MKDIFDVTLNDKPYYLVRFYTISDSYDYGGAYGFGCIADVFGPFLTHAEAERKANELIVKGRK